MCVRVYIHVQIQMDVWMDRQVDLQQEIGLHGYEGCQGKSEISVGPAMRKGRLELLDVGRNCGPQAEFLLHWRNLSSAVKAFQLIKSGSPT